MRTKIHHNHIETIRQDVHDTYQALKEFIDTQLVNLDPPLLYKTPSPKEWTLMENLAHIIEIMPYWAHEIELLVSKPGQNFGRTIQHAGRLQAIIEHGSDTLESASQNLSASYLYMDQVFSTLHDSDLEKRGTHTRFGDQTLGWFIEEFVTEHLANHFQQMQVSLALLQNS